jgi:hypothetical protein
VRCCGREVEWGEKIGEVCAKEGKKEKKLRMNVKGEEEDEGEEETVSGDSSEVHEYIVKNKKSKKRRRFIVTEKRK